MATEYSYLIAVAAVRLLADRDALLHLLDHRHAGTLTRSRSAMHILHRLSRLDFVPIE